MEESGIPQSVPEGPPRKLNGNVYAITGDGSAIFVDTVLVGEESTSPAESPEK